MAGTTITKPSYNSSTPAQLSWLLMTSGGANNYIDVDGLDGSKIIFLVAHESTKVAAGSTIYIGTSDSATTRSAAANLYSGAGLNRMKLKLAKATKGSAYAKFRTTATTRTVSMSVLGPFETARFKDSDGYIKFAKAITGSTTAHVAAILLP